MASQQRTWAAGRETNVSDLVTSSGNAKDLHAPVGLYSGYKFRDLIRFDLDWNGVYQIKRARLRLRQSSQTHIARGGSPRVEVRRITSQWAAQGGDEGSWSSSASANWSNKPSTTNTGMGDSGVISASNDEYVWIDITDIVDAWAPATVLKSGGTAGGGETNSGVELRSSDETATSKTTEFASLRADAEYKRPVIELTYSDNTPPTISLDSVWSDAATTPVVVGTSFLGVGYLYSDVDGDAHDLVVLEVWPDATIDATATEANAANRVGTTGPVTPLATGPSGQYAMSISNIPTGTIYKHRLNARDARGAWSGFTTLARFQMASTPGIPLNPQMETKQIEPHIYGTLNGSGSLSRWEGEFFLDDALGSRDLWHNAGKDVSGTRSDVTWGGESLSIGWTVRWHQRHTNDALITGPWSPWYFTPILSDAGATVGASLGTKILSRTQAITLTFPNSSDAYQWRIYRTSEGASAGSGELIYPSEIVAISAATSAAPTLPTLPGGEPVVTWGDYLEIEAAARPAGTGTFGPFGPRAQCYVNSLPNTSTMTATDEDGNTGSVIPTLDVVWSSPYDDRDESRYAETPSGKELEIRVAATPQGSGGLIERRNDTNLNGDAIPEDERTGLRLDALDATTGWSAGTGATLSTVATNPGGYGGESLHIVIAGLTAGNTSAQTKTYLADLSAFGNGTFTRVYSRVSTLTNLGSVRIGVGGATWAAYWDVTPSAPNVFELLDGLKSAPTAASGTIDWEDVAYLVIAVTASGGTFTGNVIVRDWQLGSILAAGYTYDARARYRDDATPKATTYLAADSAIGATNIKYTATADIDVGDDITVVTTAGVSETRRVTAVGTIGSGGTGIDLAEALEHAHVSTDALQVYYWGAWTAWKTAKVSLPPTVVLTSPTSGATVTDATPAFVHTFAGSEGKAQASHRLRVFLRGDVDDLIYQVTTDGTGLSVTGPALLLEDGETYAWEVTAWDTEGLSTTTARFPFTADFTRPTAVTNLSATADTATSSVALAWTAVSGTDHYRVYWRDAHGRDVRIDAGPVEVGDGRTPLTDVVFTHYGARLGVNTFTVTSHNGAIDGEGDSASTTVTLDSPDPGLWMLVHETEERYTMSLWATQAPRSHGAIIERYAPPGRGSTLHRKWGTSGASVSLGITIVPGEVDPGPALEELLDAMDPVWLKAPTGYTIDPSWVTVVGISDTPESAGFRSLDVDLEETER